MAQITAGQKYRTWAADYKKRKQKPEVNISHQGGKHKTQ